MIKHLNALLAALILTLPAATALAQDETTLRLLPEYTPCVYQGVRYACYSADQQAVLNALEIQARGWREQLTLSESLRLNLDQLVVNLQAQIAQYLALSDERTAAIEDLQRRLLEETEARDRYRREAENADWLSLTLGVAVGVLGLGFGIGALIATGL